MTPYEKLRAIKDAEKFAEARKSLTYALIGAIIIFGVGVLINTVTNVVCNFFGSGGASGC